MYSAPTPQPRKLLTPALVAALVGLALLAVATVVVVLRNDGGSTTDAAASSSAATAGGQLVSATDDSFTFTMPDGYEDGVAAVLSQTPIVAVFNPDSGGINDPNTTTVSIVTSAGATGLDAYVDAAKSQILDEYGASSNQVDLAVTSVDGEDLVAVESEPFETKNIQVRLLFIVTTHNGQSYVIILKAAPDAYNGGYDACMALLESITWTS